jgi:hypothetical protein
MKSQIILNSEIIIKEYKEGMGVEKLALKYHVGKVKIKNILFENGIELKKKGRQKKEIKYGNNILVGTKIKGDSIKSLLLLYLY